MTRMTMQESKDLGKLPPLKITIRQGTKKDIGDVCAIERGSYVNPWTPDDFERCIRRRRHALIVAISGNFVVGYITFEAQPNALHVLNMAVHPKCRHRGVGRQLLGWLVSQLKMPRKVVMILARETNLEFHLFLRAVGFKACEVIRRHYSDTDEDAYRFEHPGY